MRQMINISVSRMFWFGVLISRAVSCCTMGWWFGTLRWTWHFIHHPTKWFLILWNCGILTFASCTSNKWRRMFGFRKYIRFSPKLILSPQGRQQSLSLEINPVCNAEPCFPHDNIVGSHLCGECMKSNELNIGHKLLSILWLISQVCSLTKECLVYPCVPNTSILRQYVSILVIILPLVQVLPVSTDDHPSEQLKLFALALCFCSPYTSLKSLLGWPSFQTGGTWISWRVVKSMLTNCLEMLVFGTNWWTWQFWSVNKLARSVTKWTRTCDRCLARLVTYIHHTSDNWQYCHG